MAPNPALPYRDDCWSEGETSALVAAWGDRYVELNRGNLRQKHWQEVADAVNSRAGAARRPSRTDVQCKNRIDTLKKKYKAEKAKNNPAGSPWLFYNRLDALIGSSVTTNKPSVFSSGINRKPGEEKNSFLLPTFSRKPGAGNLALGFSEGERMVKNSVLSSTFSRDSGPDNFFVGFPDGSRPVEVKREEKNSVLLPNFSRKPGPGNFGVGIEGVEREDESVLLPLVALPMNSGRKPGVGDLPVDVKREEERRLVPQAVIGVDEMILRRAQAAAAAAEAEDDSEEEESEEEEVGEEGEGVRELARAIMGFAEVYERVEIAKQRQMMEMERQRMEFAKEVEFQRMQVFVDSQVRLEKLKRAKRSNSDGGKL